MRQLTNQKKEKAKDDVEASPAKGKAAQKHKAKKAKKQVQEVYSPPPMPEIEMMTAGSVEQSLIQPEEESYYPSLLPLQPEPRQQAIYTLEQVTALQELERKR